MISVCIHMCDVAVATHPNHITACRDDARYVADHVLEEVSCVRFGANEYSHALWSVGARNEHVGYKFTV